MHHLQLTRVLTWICVLLDLFHTAFGLPSMKYDFSRENPHSGRSKRKSYSGYKLLRTEPISLDNVAALEDLESLGGVSFWSYPGANKTVDIFTSPNQLPQVKKILNDLSLDHDVIFHDAEEIMEYEQSDSEGRELQWSDDKENNMINSSNLTGQERMSFEGTGRAIPQDFFTRYQRYNEIMNFASQLAREYPSIASFQSIGKSYEGRDIGLFKISTGGKQTKPGIFIDGGMHAREWISPATVTYIMYRLLKDPNAKPLVDMFDWYIVPIVNVDGYEYTHTTDRYWRKTRSRSSNGCVGVDPNRNFGFHWAESGSSNKPCSDIYHGPRAFSEVETQALGRTIMYLKDQLKLYLTFHAYSQMWLVPWGYVKNQKPPTYNEMMRMAQFGKTALEKTYGTQYSLGTAPDLLYPAAGGSDDWALGAVGIPYSYCLELRDKGRYGFALPPNQIRPTGEETYNGVAALAKELYRTLKRQHKGRPLSNSNSKLNARIPRVRVAI